MTGQRMDDQAVAAGYARLYGPLAASALVIAFLPLLEDDFGTLWQMASDPAGGPAVFGAVLMVTLIGCLVAAAFRPVRSEAMPITIVCLAAAILLMLITRPATGDPKPGLTPGGDAAVAVSVATIVLGLAHTVQLRLRRR